MKINGKQVSIKKSLIIVVVHALGVAGVVHFFNNFSWSILVAWLFIYYAFTLSITVGYHRYFRHKAFKATPEFAKVLSVGGAASWQGPAKDWEDDHKDHHTWEDVQGKDLHTPKDGFFWSHMGWLFVEDDEEKKARVYLRASKKKDIRNMTMVWQADNYALLAVGVGYIIPLIIGAILGDVIAGLLFLGFTRQIVQWHVTWSVNSIGHKFGERIDANATNFGGNVMAVISGGESWHANHHVSQSHYSLARRPGEIDPGARVIEFAEKKGWASDLRRPRDRKNPPWSEAA